MVGVIAMRVAVALLAVSVALAGCAGEATNEPPAETVQAAPDGTVVSAADEVVAAVRATWEAEDDDSRGTWCYYHLLTGDGPEANSLTEVEGAAAVLGLELTQGEEEAAVTAVQTFFDEACQAYPPDGSGR